LSEADAFFSCLGFDDLVALDRQQVPDKLAALVVILDDQNQLIRQGAPAV
jgi:hypothetical protein